MRKILRTIERMKVDTRDIRSATQAARNFGAIIEEVEAGTTIVVVKNNRPVVGIAPIATMERLIRVEEREEDLRLLAVAFTRAATSQGPLREWDEVAAELGIDLDEVGAVPDDSE
jgi:prevent-host-death family protein